MNYKTQRQLTVALENQPGRLAAVCKKLADHGINIKDLTVLDNADKGVIRLVTSDPALTKQLLHDEGHYVIESDVLIVDLPDTPGRLAQLAAALAEAQINIDYAYGTEDPSEQKIRIILKVSSLARACDVLAKFKE